MPLSSAPTAYGLRVDDRRESLTIATDAPVLQWRMRGDRTPALVRVQAATSASALLSGEADLWDTGAMAVLDPGNRVGRSRARGAGRPSTGGWGSVTPSPP